MSSNIRQTSNFSPNQISGCQLWLDAADKSTITGTSTVSSWVDKSSTGRTVTFSGTVAYDAVNKNIYTDGSSYFYANVDSRKTTVPNLTVFIVYKALNYNSGTNQSLWGTDVGGGWNRFQLLNFPAVSSLSYGLAYTPSSPNTTNVSGLNNGNLVLYNALYSLNVTNATGVYVNASSASTFVTEAAAQVQTSSTDTYFAAVNPTQYQSPIAFYEIIWYSSTISDTTRQFLEGYLAWKWGLNRSLPTNHPYYNTPAYSFNMPNVIFPRYAYKTLPFSFPGFTLATYATNGVFNPKSLSGCVVWFDAKDQATLVFNGTNLSTWTSKGSSSLTATASGTIKYALYNGKLALRFNGVDSKMTTGSISSYGASATTWITASVNLTAVTTLTPTDASLVFASATSNVEKSIRYTNIANVSNSQIYTFNPNLASMRYSTNYDSGIRGFIDTAASFTAYVNGANATSVTNAVTYTAVTNPTFVMGQWSSGTLDGYIQEIIVYNRALSLLEYQQVEGYLAWKWGTVATLPSSHPYKLFPPPP